MTCSPVRSTASGGRGTGWTWARYGESDGFERNAPRPNAWHYRDWVIRALNSDMPYDQFAKQQLAGDAGGDPDGTKAAGFLVAGIHNTVLGSNKVSNDTARQDELEDVVAAVGQTFLGLSVQCARCHDHKFDPIGQRDYYRMTAALGGVTHGERTTATAARAKLLAEQAELNRKLAALESAARVRVRAKNPDGKKTTAAPPLALLVVRRRRVRFGGRVARRTERRGEGGERPARAGRKKVTFVQTAPLAADLKEKTLEAWVILPDLATRGGGVITVEMAGGVTFDSIVFGEQQPRRWMAGSNGFVRTRTVSPADETALRSADSRRHRVRRRRQRHPVPRRRAGRGELHAEGLAACKRTGRRTPACSSACGTPAAATPS